jgi:2-deoxy-D-gluconate 3-dehydrogenase
MILDEFRLDGQTAIVTGAGRGLGRALALGLAEAGANLALAGRTAQKLDQVKGEIEALGQRAICVPTDVRKLGALDHLVARTLDAFGRIDILVNNAGTTHRAPAVEYPEGEWDRVMDVNVKAVFFLCQKVAKVMIQQGRGGRIINIASLISVIGMPDIPAYAASKAGVLLLTRSLAVEWAPHNIRVNAIGPGYFKTELTAGLEDHPDRGPKIKLRIPMKRWGEPEDLKGAVVFLASDASRYVTGQTIFVDGGWLAG